MQHSNQMGAAAAAFGPSMANGGANPYTQLGSNFNPALLQAMANAGTFGGPGARSHPSVSNPSSMFGSNVSGGAPSSFSNIFSNPTMSAYNPYANFFLNGAAAAAAAAAASSGSYPPVSPMHNSVLGMGLPGRLDGAGAAGRPPSPFSFASHFYKNSAAGNGGKLPTDGTPLSLPSFLPTNFSIDPSAVNGGLSRDAAAAHSRFHPYHHLKNFNFGGLAANPQSFMQQRKLEQMRRSAPERPRSGSLSPTFPSSLPSNDRLRSHSESSDNGNSGATTGGDSKNPLLPSSTHFNPPNVSSAVQELRNMENLVSGLERKRHHSSEHTTKRHS